MYFSLTEVVLALRCSADDEPTVLYFKLGKYLHLVKLQYL
jgi:hypothetical protein